jgi:hypothetical protein
MQDFAGKPFHGQGGNVPHSRQAGAGVHPAGPVESGERPHQQ